jgi:hypothetical protein
MQGHIELAGSGGKHQGQLAATNYTDSNFSASNWLSHRVGTSHGSWNSQRAAYESGRPVELVPGHKQLIGSIAADPKPGVTTLIWMPIDNFTVPGSAHFLPTTTWYHSQLFASLSVATQEGIGTGSGCWGGSHKSWGALLQTVHHFLGLLNLLVHRCHLSGHISSDRLGIGLGSLR